MNLDKFTLDDLENNLDLIEEAYIEDLGWNCDDLDFSDSKHWQYMLEDIEDELTKRATKDLWDTDD